ncbi:protein Mom [Consotaella aegiceratis]|uniref:Mom family adenine methylcarbamoylation protein n=1 Tax=Consotaella aegiceratis TaxID=3097961 RepID=UPI002F427060
MSGLRLDWVGNDAVTYACEHWHYSRSVPAGRKMAVGVWEAGVFKGVVIFSRGSTPLIGSPYGLSQSEVCELTRVALREHKAPVSRIVAIAIRLLRKAAPGLRLIVSYAAHEQGHHGGIYQAGGWIYEGPMESHSYIVKGKPSHARSLVSKYGSSSLDWLQQNVDPYARKIADLVRHKYLMPLDGDIRDDIRRLAKPYPKRAKQATDGDHPDGGGAAPTRALQDT